MQDSTSCYQLQKLNLVYLQNWVSLFFMCGKRIYKHFVEKVFQWYTKKSLKLSRLYLILTNSLTIMRLRSHHKTLIKGILKFNWILAIALINGLLLNFQFSIINFLTFVRKRRKLAEPCLNPPPPVHLL